MIADRDALAKLAKAWVVETVAQFGLAHENDLKELAIVGLEIREQTDLFEQLIGQILGFVNNQNGVLSALDLLKEKLIDHGQSIQSVQAVDRKTKLYGDGLHQFVRTHYGIEDERGRVLVIQVLEHRAAESGFAGAD